MCAGLHVKFRILNWKRTKKQVHPSANNNIIDGSFIDNTSPRNNIITLTNAYFDIPTDKHYFIFQTYISDGDTP